MTYEVRSYEDYLKYPAPHIRGPDLIKMQLPPVKWAVENLISQGVTLLAGPPKCGKSTLITDIGLSVASGAKAFGKLGVQQGTVLYFALEPTLQDLQAELEIMMQGEEIPEDFIIIPRCPSLAEGGKEVIEQDLKYYSDTVMVIIDTMGRMRGTVLPTREYSYAFNLEDMNFWAELSKTHNANIILIHHTKRSERKRKDEEESNHIDEVLGSRAIVGSADTLLIMKEYKSPKTISFTGRSSKRLIYRDGRSPLIEPKVIQTGFDHSTHRSKLEGGIVDNSQERAEILEAVLKLHSEGKHVVQPKEVAEYLKKDNTGAVRKLMLAMIHADPPQLVKKDYGKYCLP
jgi:hypothetical protein